MMNDHVTETNTPAVQPQPNREAAVVTPEPQPQPNPPKMKRAVIVLIAVVIAAIVGCLAFLFWPKSCFDPNSYKALIALAQDFEGGEGLEVADVAQDEELFTQSIYFKDQSTDVDLEVSDDPTELFQKLGTYYKEHQTTAPISLTVESSYPVGTFSDIAKQRIAAVKNGLVKAGVAELSVTAKDPTAITIDEDSQFDDDLVDGIPAGVRITPVSRCQE